MVPKGVNKYSLKEYSDTTQRSTQFSDTVGISIFRAYLSVHHYVIESPTCHHFQSRSVTHVRHCEEVCHQTLDFTAVPVLLRISAKSQHVNSYPKKTERLQIIPIVRSGN